MCHVPRWKMVAVRPSVTRAAARRGLGLACYNEGSDTAALRQPLAVAHHILRRHTDDANDDTGI